MKGLDILFLFIFVLSTIFILNQLLTIIVSIFSDKPKQITYIGWDKISNYFFISYFITYIITVII